MSLSEFNVQLGGVLLQPFIDAMKMHCQPRLVCDVNIFGGENLSENFGELKV